MFLELYSGQGEVSPVLSNRNHLGHTVPATTGKDFEPISEIHTAFVLCLLSGSPWHQALASPVALQAGASQKVLEPSRVWIHSPDSQPLVPQVPYWSGEFLRGCWQGDLSKQAKLPPDHQPPGNGFCVNAGKTLAASLYPRMNGEKRKSL